MWQQMNMQILFHPEQPTGVCMKLKKITDGIYLINSFRNELKWIDNQDQVHQKNGINGSGIYSVEEKNG